MKIQFMYARLTRMMRFVSQRILRADDSVRTSDKPNNLFSFSTLTNTMLIVMIAFFTLWGGLNVSGYCFETSRYLSDKEKIHIAVDYALKRGFKGKIDYKNAGDFLASNPSCCEISTTIMASGVNDSLDRVSGNLASYVYVLEDSFNARPEDKAMSAIAISNCGKAWSFFD